MANPTTNYGWPMPTSTDLVTDLPADFAAFGQPVDTSLKALNPETTLGDIAYRSATANTNTRLGIGSTGQVLTVASGVPSWATPTAGMTNPMTTTGDTIYSSSGSTPARLGIGSTGNVLTVAGGVPTWAAPAGGGKVLQVVQGTTATTISTSSTSAVDTGLTATITPSSASSKILVLAKLNCFTTKSGAGTANDGDWNLLRGATGLQQQYIGTYSYASASNTEFYGGISFNYLDSPATTSATTYKVQYACVNASAVYVYGAGTRINSIVLMEIGA